MKYQKIIIKGFKYEIQHYTGGFFKYPAIPFTCPSSPDHNSHTEFAKVGFKGREIKDAFH
jgi:hypothetical protein